MLLGSKERQILGIFERGTGEGQDAVLAKINRPDDRRYGKMLKNCPVPG